MKITGAYESDNNFTWVYTQDRLYTIAKNGDWGYVELNKSFACGGVLTTRYLESRSSGLPVGTFTLK